MTRRVLGAFRSRAEPSTCASTVRITATASPSLQPARVTAPTSFSYMQNTDGSVIGVVASERIQFGRCAKAAR